MYLLYKEEIKTTTTTTATGYGVCFLHCIRLSCDCRRIIVRLMGTTPYGGCAEIARISCSFSGVIAQSPQHFHGLVLVTKCPRTCVC